MMLRSAPNLVACCTATFGLHSSSSTTSSYSYFALGSALRRRTARSAELRPPSPLAAVPPVGGPMKPTLTLSLAAGGSGRIATVVASAMAESDVLLIIGASGRSRSDAGTPVVVRPWSPTAARRARPSSSLLAARRGAYCSSLSLSVEEANWAHGQVLA